MKRRVFHLACGISLLIGVAAACLAIRSYWAVDSIISQTSGRGYHVISIRGLLVVRRSDAIAPASLGPIRLNFASISVGDLPAVDDFIRYWQAPFEKDYPNTTSIRFAGGRFLILKAPFSVAREQVLIVPLWMISVAAAAMPGWWIIRRRSRRQISANACRHCGYDLRATPDRCPECGTGAHTSAREDP
jgi:hypothetical protein